MVCLSLDPDLCLTKHIWNEARRSQQRRGYIWNCSQDGDLMISVGFIPRGNFSTSQTCTVHTHAPQQNLLRQHFAAAGQMLGLFLGLFLKTLISSPLFPSQLIDSWDPLQHGRLIITSLIFVRRPSFFFLFFFPSLTAGDVTSAATEIKVKLLVVTWVSSFMSLVDMCNNTPLLQCNKEVDCFLTALGLPHLGRLLEKAFLWNVCLLVPPRCKFSTSSPSKEVRRTPKRGSSLSCQVILYPLHWFCVLVLLKPLWKFYLLLGSTQAELLNGLLCWWEACRGRFD